MLHGTGLAASAKATVKKSCGKYFSAIMEISSILQDFRIDSVGGIKAGLAIYELALVPSLLNNADTWVDISKETVNRLESMQNTMFRYLIAVLNSTPQPILRFELGHLSMKEKNHIKKLCLLYYLRSLPAESLGNEFYEMQVKYSFPGLISECRKLIKYYILEDIIDGNVVLSKQVWKKRVKNAVRIKSEELLKKEFNNYSKLKNLDSPKEEFKVKDYVKDMMTIRNARTMFKIRSHMTDVKFNQKSNQKFAN